MTRRLVVPVTALVLLSTWSLRATAEMTEISMVKLDVSTQINATPSEVWTQMTTGKDLVGWCPYWKSDKNKKAMISKVGDTLDFTDDWGNGGQSVITFLDPDKEMRITHEPSNGSYVCQSRLVLEPSDGGTTVKYVEQYTDESDPEDRIATSVQMEKAMTAALAALKKMAEKK
jgi:uncharacterized protein YndB with AHSA1/START domain